MNTISFAEKRLVPDRLIRIGIRQLLKKRLYDEFIDDPNERGIRYERLLNSLKSSPIAIETEAANDQHYEVPAEFFKYVLGENLKYSACYWDDSTEHLGQAEQKMLDLYLLNAQIKDGQEILELGCGWGSLTLWMAERFPRCKITAVSNSASQRQHIESQLNLRGLENVQVITCDVNKLSIDRRFDRVVSVEMFEHVRNYESLLQKISQWLKPGGKLFVHIFCHKVLAYPFETEGDDNWMGRYFFTGGLMPARDTLLYFQNNLSIEKQWSFSGSHYKRTAEAWLSNLDEYKKPITNLFDRVYGPDEGRLWVQRWRMFFMACSELFGY
ncbi:MAG: cyclopropane-fatty-acyl-phospholipid synthase family protein, partial [Arenicellales bacterium]|nr:cyclopropane-fatty-acyl-phospholipid synthase family protein [Arenicellales bacterium]